MNIKKLTLNSPNYPHVLRNIHSAPQELYQVGTPIAELLKLPRIAIVGSRKISAYGQQVTERLARELAEQGIVIVSGLALGVDATAHRAALEAGGLCIGVLPCPPDNIVPVANARLAQKILENGGTLISEYAPGLPPYKQNFVARNRLMSGLADVVLITEAAEKSGSLHTARFALEQGRDVLVIPGDVTRPNYVGANNLIKAGKAALVTNLSDILHIMKLHPHQTAARAVKGRNAHEQTVLNLMLQGITDGDTLLEQSSLTVSEFNRVLTMLEIGSKVRPLGLNHWAIF